MDDRPPSYECCSTPSAPEKQTVFSSPFSASYGEAGSSKAQKAAVDTTLQIDMHPLKTLEEYVAMLHVRNNHPSSRTPNIDSRNIISILRRKDQRFTAYSEADL